VNHITIKKERLLIVEGKDEELFFDALLKHLNISNIQILSIGGKTKFRKNLGALLNRREEFAKVKRLWITRDADDDFNSAFQSICDALKALELPVPKKPKIPTSSCPEISIFIFPDNQSPGMLEDLCLKVLQDNTQDTPIIKCLEDYFCCLARRSPEFPNNLSKAKIQAFLAAKKEPGKRLEEAAQSGYFPWDHPAFNDIKEFLFMLSNDSL
jgi:hypothetical protein